MYEKMVFFGTVTPTQTPLLSPDMLISAFPRPVPQIAVRPVRFPPFRVGNCLEFNMTLTTSACDGTGDRGLLLVHKQRGF